MRRECLSLGRAAPWTRQLLPPRQFGWLQAGPGGTYLEQALAHCEPAWALLCVLGLRLYVRVVTAPISEGCPEK